MSRTKKQSPLEVIIDITAMLPWWAGVLLAVIAYFICQHYATAEIPRMTSTSAAQISANVSGQLGRMFATLGQYLLPLAFLVGAAMSAYGRHKRNTLFGDVRGSTSTTALNGMTWQEFEMLVGEAFRRKGYAVSETGGGGADGGVDLALNRGGEKFLVQCKQWKAYKVGVTTVRELYGVMAAIGATGGFVVTSGKFTQEAKAFAKGINITLIDGPQLTALIKSVPQQPAAVTAAAQRKHQKPPVLTAVPLCPKCGNIMIKRTAKQGEHAGKIFWECSGFPQCRGIITID